MESPVGHSSAFNASIDFYSYRLVSKLMKLLCCVQVVEVDGLVMTCCGRWTGRSRDAWCCATSAPTPREHTSAKCPPKDLLSTRTLPSPISPFSVLLHPPPSPHPQFIQIHWKCQIIRRWAIKQTSLTDDCTDWASDLSDFDWRSITILWTKILSIDIVVLLW